MFAPTHNRCRHLQPWWLSRLLCFCRYFVLYEHGGVYADLDSECLKPIQPIVEDYSCILSQEPLEHAHFLGPLGKIALS